MAGSKEIRDKIKSVKNTQKITKAMEMVAASKMRKAQARMAATRPYADKMRQVIGHVASAHPEYKHPYTQAREKVRSVAYIIVSSDRGLCGGLNANVFKSVLSEMKAKKNEGVNVKLALVGNKAESFFRSYGGDTLSSVAGIGDTPHIDTLFGSVKVMLDAFEAGEIDALFLVSNVFVNTMTQKATVRQLIPTQANTDASSASHWDYLYEPEAKEVLDLLMKRYIESAIFSSVVENIACEQAARMLAMKNASDNAKNVIKELTLAYNKARQAAITQEISEIVGGAAAVS
jgi:F-type H+-transporting ATPase subunit gamma